MANWQAPSTNNQGDATGVAQSAARPYLAADGRVHWWKGTDALPGGSTPLYIIVRGDGKRVLSTNATPDEREPYLFGTQLLFW